MIKVLAYFIVILSLNLTLPARAQVKEPRIDEKWIKEVAPYRIAGNLYFVGTQDLGCYLVTTPKGHVLINTGVASSFETIAKNISKLGFKATDIKILLCSQAHYDHMGAMAAMKQLSGARFCVEEHDAQVVRDGGVSDYEMGKYGRTFAPVQPDELLHDESIVKLGAVSIKVLHHPGHTKGSCSFLFTVTDSAKSYRVLIANMPTVIVESKLHEVKSYPNMIADYKKTFKSLKEQKFDLWFAAHDSQCQINTKHKAGDAYNPEAFRDQKGFDEQVAELEKEFREKE